MNRFAEQGDVPTLERQEEYSSLKATLREGLRRRFRGMREELKKAIPGAPKGEYLIWGLFLGLSLFFVWSALSGPQGAIKFLELKASLDELEERNRVLLQRNQGLEKEVYLLRNSPEFLEKIAREEYGYIYPGEKVYEIPGPDQASGAETQREHVGQESPTPP